MPAPNFAPSLTQDQHDHAAQHTLTLTEEASRPGGVQAHVANGIVTQPARDTIEESKQKARMIVASSGVPSNAAMKSTAFSDLNGFVSGAQGAQPTGPAQSRKRSRSGSRIPQDDRSLEPNNRRDRLLLEQYVNRELIHTARVVESIDHSERVLEMQIAETDYYKNLSRERRINPGAVFGKGYAGLGNGLQDTQGRGAKILYPIHRMRPGGRKPKELLVSKKDRMTLGEQIDELVPIRLEIEWDKIRLRDTFTWNVNERVVPLELFAEQLVEDLRLPIPQCESLVHQVYASMQEQIVDFHPHVFIDEEPLDPHLPYSAYKNDEMRIIIKLNITIGQHTLVDQFEWEINNPNNSPEDFARQMTKDLSLTGEFTTAIAHSIREQCQLFTRSLYVVGHPFDGRPIEDHELQASFQPSPLPSVFRPHQAAKEFTPYLYELNEAELEKTELSLSREERRQKRSVNRRGGPALPDLKDRRRTIRTLVVSSVIPGAAESLEDSRIFKRTATAGKTKRGRAEDSDDSDSEDSAPESSEIGAHLLAGTARTRGMRGAASAAQAAMRANLGRSATPESTSHFHETRTSGRRTTVGREYRETSSPEPQSSLIVKLRLGRQKFQQFLRSQRATSKEAALQGQARPSSENSTRATPATSTPALATRSMGPPTSAPRTQSHHQSSSSTKHANAQHAKPGEITAPTSRHGATSTLGRVDAAGPPGPEHPIPPPPPTLMKALESLRREYPEDAFEGTMRYTAVSTDSDEPFTIKPDAPLPTNTKYCYYPRIRCKDCPGKLYTPDLNLGANNFEVHLRNRQHRDRVAARLREEEAAEPTGLPG